MTLDDVIIHGSPDVRQWKETVKITSLTMRPGKEEGVSFEFEPRQAWPDYTPPGWDGPIQYTVWPVVKVGGQWHTAGIIQMWRTRPSTGAPLLQQWSDWCYDRGRWGVMCDYRPQVGDEVGFFLTAGNARGTKEVTSVAERSNIVVVKLPPGDFGSFTFTPTGPVGPPVVTPPEGHQCKCDEVLAEVKAVKALLEDLYTRPEPAYVGRVNYPNVSLWPVDDNG